MPPSEWERTPIWRIRQYATTLREHRAELKGMLIEAAIFPWTDDDGRRAIRAADAPPSKTPVPQWSPENVVTPMSHISEKFGIPFVEEDVS